MAFYYRITTRIVDKDTQQELPAASASSVQVNKDGYYNAGYVTDLRVGEAVVQNNDASRHLHIRAALATGYEFDSFHFSAPSASSTQRTQTSTANPMGALAYANYGATSTNTSEATALVVTLTVYVTALAVHTLTFDDNGGSGGPGTVTVVAGSSYTIPSTAPTRSGYDFDCWMSDGESYDPGDEVTPEDDMYFVAVWQGGPTPSSSRAGHMVRSASADSIVFSRSSGAFVYAL